MLTYIDIIGLLAAFCTTAAFIPQAVKVIKTKDARSLSLAMYTVFTLGVALWLSYGLLKQDLPMIIANIITFVLASLILGVKIYTECHHLSVDKE